MVSIVQYIKTFVQPSSQLNNDHERLTNCMRRDALVSPGGGMRAVPKMRPSATESPPILEVGTRSAECSS